MPLPPPVPALPVTFTAPVDDIAPARLVAEFAPEPVALIVTPPVPELTAAVWLYAILVPPAVSVAVIESAPVAALLLSAL